MIIFILITIIVLTIIFIFASPKLSPIPYYPSNKKDKNLIIEALTLKNNHVMIDLGAGDGWIIFEAARQSLTLGYNTKFIAVDINPILILLMNIKRLFHPNKKNITIMLADFFSTEFWRKLTSFHNSSLIIHNYVFYLYISPRFMYKTKEFILSYFPNATIVTYLYSFNEIEPIKVFQGVKKIFVFTARSFL